METAVDAIFQIDSAIVTDFYNNHPNYIIEYNEDAPKEYCILYFSSNDLYYPNSDIAFAETIVKKNKFEWYRTRVGFGHKHIFLRDIKKQWYLTGINATINNPQALLQFLEKETEGYKVILLGSSAGGFISVILGQLLNAERIYSFNGQFEIVSLLDKPNPETVNPLIFRNKNNPEVSHYFKARNFITNPKSIFYFHSTKSYWDIQQNEEVKDLPINRIFFTTSNHGIPFLKSNLPVVLNFSMKNLKALSGKTIHPLFFSLQTVGFVKTMQGLTTIIQFGLNKIYIRTIQKWKKAKS